MGTHILDLQWSQGNLQKADRVTISAEGEANLSVPVPDSSTDLQALVAIDFSQLKMFYLVSDQDVTIETNNATTPDDTFNLKKGIPLVWYVDCGHTNPITVDVTALFITNSSGSTANVELRTLQDATP